MTTLGALLADAGLTVSISDDVAHQHVSTVELDSRLCTPGSVFVCVPGSVTRGEAFVGDALRRGAVCVVSATSLNAPVVVRVEADDLRGVLTALASSVVGHPASSLTTAGVTGTNGKTTVTWLLEGILSGVGYAASSIGTLTGQRTTPAAPALQRELRDVADRAAAAALPGAVAVEVSSHALDQGRVDGIRFDVAVFTNLSREHLDYHGTMEAYFEAKASLFEPEHASTAVVCVDDTWGRMLEARATIPKVAIATSEATMLDLVIGATTFRWHGRVVTTGLTGMVNVTNAMLALGAADVLGIDGAEAIGALATVPPVPGRLELVDGGPPSVLVDYAHSPDALERVLRDLRAIRPEDRMVVVFGCGGERDQGKRPVMGSIASRLADEVVVTSDNPRGEPPEAIIEAVVAGCDGDARVVTEVDRAAAIDRAIVAAADDDVVLVAGKGHEATQEIGGQVIPFDDRVVVAAALRARRQPC